MAVYRVAAILALVQLFVLAPAQRITLFDLLSPADKPFDSNGANFDILTRFLRRTNLTQAVSTLSNFTLFAPNDRAFVRTTRYITNFNGSLTDEAAAFEAAVAAIDRGVQIGNETISGVQLLGLVLLYHIAPLRISLRRLLSDPFLVPTIALQETLPFISVGTGELVDRSPATPNPALVPGFVNITLANGMIVHAIDAVLLPVPVDVPLQRLFSCGSSI